MEVFGLIALIMILMFAVAAALAFRIIRRKQKLREGQKSEAEKAQITHDLNNALAVLKAAAESLEKKAASPEDVRVIASVLAKCAERAARLNADNTISFRDALKQTGVTDVHECLQECLLLLETATGGNITIYKNLEAENYGVKVDEASLQSLFLNLGKNAADAMKGKGSITVTTRNIFLSGKEKGFLRGVLSGNYLEICFADTGCGIPKEIQNNIFEPYFTTKKDNGGKGLGLVSVLETVVSATGTMRFETSSNGTAFYLYFPVIENEQKKQKAKKNLPSLKAEVLVVDDEPILQELMSDVLVQAGCLVALAMNAREALDAFQAGVFKAVVLDVVMPEKDGVELYEDLRKRDLSVKIIFTSGYSKDERIKDIIKKDKFADFVQKPYDAAEVVEKLAILLAKEQEA